jgi:hypothetical protein
MAAGLRNNMERNPEMTAQPMLRPDLAAACLFAKPTKRREPCPPPMPSGVLAELARLRFFH